MRKLWQNDFGVRGLFHHQSVDTCTASSYLTGKLVRYVVDGVPSPVPSDATVADATSFARENAHHMAMFLYANPTTAQIEELADAWGLHPVLVEDLLSAGQRPKLERYGDTLFLVARAARYVDETELRELAHATRSFESPQDLYSALGDLL